MKINSVIFDLDGTLLDTIEDIADANNEMLRSYGYPEHPVEKYVEWIGNGALKLVVASLPHDAEISKEKLKDYLHEYSLNYSRNIDNKTKIYEGIEGVLDYLTAMNIPMSINTNKPHDLTLSVCGKYFKPWQFRYIYGNNGAFPKKPDPQAALSIAGSLDFSPQNILFIGDSEVDLKTAKNAGMMALGVRWGYGSHVLMEQVGASAIVDRPSQIIEFISKS